jgi:hypothetical protein
VFGLKRAPEFEAWLQAQDRAGRVAASRRLAAQLLPAA